MNVKKVIDLSHTLYADCPGWMGQKRPVFSYDALYPEQGYTAERVDMNVHTGTHIDVPFHVSPYGARLDEIPVGDFQGMAVLIDFEKQNIPACTEYMPEHFKPYEDKITEGSIVVYNNGWANKRGYNHDYYTNWPYLSEEAAQWLADKKIKGICTDSMSVGGACKPDKAVPPHEALLLNGVWICEELNLVGDILNYETFYFCAFPLNFVGFTGSPVRAVAMIIE